MTRHKKIGKRKWRGAFFVGFIIGIIASWTYILLEGDYWLFIPLWAEIVFYPGLFVGNYSYDLFGNLLIAQMVGTFSVGLFYGIVLVVILFLWNLLRRKKEMSHEQ